MIAVYKYYSFVTYKQINKVAISLTELERSLDYMSVWLITVALFDMERGITYLFGPSLFNQVQEGEFMCNVIKLNFLNSV